MGGEGGVGRDGEGSGGGRRGEEGKRGNGGRRRAVQEGGKGE